MARTSSTLILNDGDREILEKKVKERTEQSQVVNRARILLLKADGATIESIAERVDLNRNSVILCLKKYKAGGLENALYDAPGRGRNAEITDDERAWVLSIACQKPVDLGYASEVWTYSRLTTHIQSIAEESGFPRLSTISRSMVYIILEDADIKPQKIRYYCENRDPNFEEHMHNVLLVYKQVSMQFNDEGEFIGYGDGEPVHVVSFDEKPGLQATANTTEDLLPSESHGVINRDYEYKRLGTVSLLAGIDLQTGIAIPLVSETHNSDDYIRFLQKLDAYYPKGDRIRIVLDNLAVHQSVKTRKYLATVPNRFEFVFTPKHGSWLNMIESFFGKMTKQMLRGIRVKTKQELIDRIYQYFEEVNQEPVVYHWKYRMSEIDVSEEVKVDTLPMLQSS